MSQGTRVCRLCETSTVEVFCCCNQSEEFLCGACLPLHMREKSSKAHHFLPMAAYGQHTIPGYFERLAERSMRFSKRESLLKANVRAIDECIQALSDKVEQIYNSLIRIRDRKIEELQVLKRKLEADIASSLKTAEETMYSDDTSTENSPVSLAWKSIGLDEEVSSLSFSLCAEKYPSTMEDILNYKMESKQNSTAGERPISLPSVRGSRFRVLSPTRECLLNVSLPHSFDERTSLVAVEQHVFLLGGTSANCYVMDTASKELQPIADMMYSCCYFGIWSSGSAVYVFGGEEKGRETRKCTKLDVRGRTWRLLPTMEHERASFNPCKLQGALFLISAGYRQLPIEAFDLASEEIRELPIVFRSNQSPTVAFAVNDEIIVLSLTLKTKFRLRPQTESEFRVSTYSVDFGDNKREELMARGGSCGVVLVNNGKAIWTIFGHRELREFDLDSNTLR